MQILATFVNISMTHNGNVKAELANVTISVMQNSDLVVFCLSDSKVTGFVVFMDVLHVL